VWPKKGNFGINYAQRINITFTNGFTHFPTVLVRGDGWGEGSLEVAAAKTNCRFIEKLQKLQNK